MKNNLIVIGVLGVVSLFLWMIIQVVELEEQEDEKIDMKPDIIAEDALKEENKEERIPDNYATLIPTDGVLEERYIQNGQYKVSYIESIVLQSFEKYEIWYPSDITEVNKKFPVVVIANATNVKASVNRPVYEHLASWGFIVIGTEELYSWNAFATEMSIRLLIKLNDNQYVEGYDANPFYNKVDLNNVGIMGHSQGGIGVINAITNTDHKDIYKAAIALSPPNKELAKGLEWDFDATLVNTPFMILSATGYVDDKALINLSQLKEIYDEIPNTTTKIMARRNKADHSEMSYYNDGYITAWFMWHLQDDLDARGAFVGDDAEMKTNKYYESQKFNITK